MDEGRSDASDCFATPSIGASRLVTSEEVEDEAVSSVSAMLMALAASSADGAPVPSPPCFASGLRLWLAARRADADLRWLSSLEPLSAERVGTIEQLLDRLQHAQGRETELDELELTSAPPRRSSSTGRSGAGLSRER